MINLKFKSLTMRIWTTFTVVILIIIFSISFLYLVAYRNLIEKAKIQDLKVAHDILLKSNDFNSPNRFDELKNLKGSEHFTVVIDENKDVKIKNGPQQGIPGQGGGNPPPMGPRGEAKNWMATFIKTNSMYEQQFKANYKDMNYLFIISSVGDSSAQTYLISYVPNFVDNSLLYLVLMIGVVFIGIGFITAKLVANYISKPLKELENFTVRIAHKDWKDPIQVKSADEIGNLTNSMNKMQIELKRADEEEKMFLQSISHDLKTPVMVIMSHADAIVEGVYIDSVEKTAEIIRDEAVRLEKKIKQMLYLNTLDYVLEKNNENSEFNLREMLTNIISRFEIVNSKISWDLNLCDVIIMSNYEKVQVAIENILDNGMRYAESEICISLTKEDEFAKIEIYNDGPIIKDEHINHIFDNLYKDKTGNFGLGLAISKKIVNYYNGDIEALNREKGVSFIIKLRV